MKENFNRFVDYITNFILELKRKKGQKDVDQVKKELDIMKKEIEKL